MLTDTQKIQILQAAVTKAVQSGPPTNYDQEGSIGLFSCCGQAEYRPHRSDCWWQALKDAHERTKG